MDLRPWGFGHGSSTMDLEKMNIKFKTQKTWIQSQIGRNTKLQNQISNPPHHQSIKHKNQTHIFGPQTQNSKPKIYYFQRNQIETSNPNLRAKTKPLATSNSKLSNLNRINLRPAKTELTSDSLLSSFSCLLGVWIWEDKGERKREIKRMGLCGF